MDLLVGRMVLLMDLVLACWAGMRGAKESEVGILNSPVTTNLCHCPTRHRGEAIARAGMWNCVHVLLRKHFPGSVVFGPASGCFTKPWASGIEEGFPQALGFGSINCFPVAA